MTTGYRIQISAFLACQESNLTDMLKASKILEDATAQLRALGFGDLDVSTKFVRGRKNKNHGQPLPTTDVDEAAE